MEATLTYFAKVAMAIAAFYSFYLLVLRHQKEFRFNRFYLSSSLYLSFLIPFITFSFEQPATQQLVILPDVATPVDLMVTGVPAGLDLFRLLFYFYLVVTGLFLLHLITGYWKAVSIVHHCRESEIASVRVYITGEDFHPFTFFNRIVVSERMARHPQIAVILKHEQVHARESHAFDILFSEILFLLQWFNPFAWLMKNAIKNNLEFLTDHEVLYQAEMEVYLLAMVTMADQKGVMPFLNAMNGNDLKNRIIMMKKKTENKNGTIRRLMVIPLLTILIAGLSNKEFKAAPIPANEVLAASLIGQEEGITESDTVKPQKKELVVIGYPAKKAYSSSATKEEKAEGSGTVRMVGAEGQPIQEQVASSKANTGNQEVTVIGYGTKSKCNSFPGDSIKVRGVASVSGVQPLYILDGKEISALDGISPESIESISVLKNESATVVYGEKGQNGVIEITMKSFTDKMIPGINTTQELRKHIAHSIRYPVEARENGQQGTIRIYAFVNSNGKITQITETKPKADIVPVDEVVIVGYAAKNDQAKLMRSSTSLNEEAALRVKNLPDLDIAELNNRWVEFQFKFALQ